MVLPNTSIINKPAMTRGLLSLAIASIVKETKIRYSI